MQYTSNLHAVHIKPTCSTSGLIWQVRLLEVENNCAPFRRLGGHLRVVSLSLMTLKLWGLCMYCPNQSLIVFAHSRSKEWGTLWHPLKHEASVRVGVIGSKDMWLDSIHSSVACLKRGGSYIIGAFHRLHTMNVHYLRLRSQSPLFQGKWRQDMSLRRCK